MAIGLTGNGRLPRGIERTTTPRQMDGRKLTDSELAAFTLATGQMVRAQARVKFLLEQYGFDPRKGYHLSEDGRLSQ